MALFVALSGTAWAAGEIGSKDIQKNAVKSKHVKNGKLRAVDFGPGQLPAGPQGEAGPTGPAGAVLSAQAAGVGNDPTGTTQFLTEPVQVNVEAGQKVLIVATRAFGTGASAAALLDLFPCYQSTQIGSPIVTQGSGILNNAVPANSRVTMGISHVITGLNAGTYGVGMCGDDDGNGNWTSGEYGYASAVVLSN